MWSPRPALVILGWILAATAALWLVVATDPAGRLLAAVAAVGLAAAALHGSIVRPRLSADADGLAVRGVGGLRRWPWSAVDVQVVRMRRLGRDVSMLELETRDAEGNEQLLVLTRLDLGTEPEDVVEALAELRPPHRRSAP
jgi:hypothetical protein